MIIILLIILIIVLITHYNVSFGEANGYYMMYYQKNIINWNGEYFKLTYSKKLWKIT